MKVNLTKNEVNLTKHPAVQYLTPSILYFRRFLVNFQHSLTKCESSNIALCANLMHMRVMIWHYN